MEALYLCNVTLVQVANLITLTRACCLDNGLSGMIYADNRYGFGVVHNFEQMWPQRSFMTSSCTLIRNTYILKLFDTLKPPKEISVVKCAADVVCSVSH